MGNLCISILEFKQNTVPFGCLIIVIYVFLYQNLNNKVVVFNVGTGTIYVFLYQNLNQNYLGTNYFGGGHLCISILEFKYAIMSGGNEDIKIYVFLYQNLNFKHQKKYGFKYKVFMYFYIRI